MALREHLPLSRLDGQVALVTGAGRGIGRAIALALSDAGAAVAVCARSEDDASGVAGQIQGRGRHALALHCDVTDRQQVQSMVAAVQEAIGPVDLLVNSAAQFGPVGPLAATNPDQWRQALEVNLRGPLYCTRTVLPGMLARGHDRIVNVSSGAGLAAIPMLSAYVVSKTALYRLSENLAEAANTHTSSVPLNALATQLIPLPYDRRRDQRGQSPPSCPSRSRGGLHRNRAGAALEQPLHLPDGAWAARCRGRAGEGMGVAG